MTGRNANIYFSEKTFDKLRKVAGVRISRFVNEAVEEKIERQEQQSQIEFEKQLIAGYKKVAQNKKLQKEMEIWDETISDMWRKGNNSYSKKGKEKK